jgi:hypothetical protein
LTLLTIIQSACDRLSLTRPSAVVSSTDRLVRQLYGIANEAGEALSKRGDPGWQSLQAEQTFITVAQQEQTNTPIPADFRRFVPGSFFDRTAQRALEGPLTPSDWQLVQARPAAASVFLTYRERAGNFLITPVPPADHTIAYEYISKYWAQSSGGTAKAQFTADEDTTYLDEELLILAIKWRFKQAKGLDYGEDMVTYEREVELALGSDSGKGALNIAGAVPLPFGIANIPEGNWS